MFGTPLRWLVRRAGWKLPAAATLVVAASVLIWAPLAGGTQPNQTYEATVASDGPVTQYQFSDIAGSTTLADSAGSDTATNTGIVLGGEGPFGGSRSGSFGGEAFASLGSNPLAGATSFTVEAWVNWAGGTIYNQPIFSLGSSSTTYMYLTPASAQTGHPMVFEIDHLSFASQVTAPKLAANAWKYVTITESSTHALTLYLNGEKVGEGSAIWSPSELGTLEANYLGKSISGTVELKGSLSNVAFYTKALSAEQVKAHYYAAEFPVNTVAPSITGTPHDGVTLTAKAGTWTGLTPIKTTFQWQSCSGEVCTNIEGATGEKYTATAANLGHSLRVAVTASNAAGEATVYSAPTAPIEAVKPANAVAPSITGTDQDGRVLTAEPGQWTGTVPINYSYQWETCNSTGASCKHITTEGTASTYRLISADIGMTLRVIVTAANQAGSTLVTSEPTPVIAAGSPLDLAAPAVSGTAQDGATLYTTNGSWVGTAPITYTYAWERCSSEGTGCTAIGGATTAAYALEPADIGHKLRVSVTATNAQGSAGVYSTTTALVEAAPPRNTSLPTIAGTPRIEQTLTASAGSWTGTPTISYAYQWLRCNAAGEACAAIEGATGTAYTLLGADVGSTIEVTVTATNSVAERPASSVPTGIVKAQPPANTEAPSISGTAQDGQTLTASAGTWTGAPLTFAYQWERCSGAGESCATIAGATSSSYLLGHADVGSTIVVAVTASDAAGEATSSSAASASVAALAPSTETAPAITGAEIVGETLSAGPGSWHGSPPFTYTYQWLACNALGEGCLAIAGATGATFKPTAAQLGGTVVVTVTAENSAGSAAATSSATAPVAEMGEAVAWGENFHGELGSGVKSNYELAPVSVQGVGAVKGVAESGFGAAIQANGEVATWGGNIYSELGDANAPNSVWEKHVATAKAGELTAATEISLKGSHGIALQEGKAWPWGSNQDGEDGNGHGGVEYNEKGENTHEGSAQPVPRPVEGLSEVVAVAAGGGDDFALKGSGELVAWGESIGGALGIGEEAARGKEPKCNLEKENVTSRCCKTEIGYQWCVKTPQKVLLPMIEGERAKVRAISGGNSFTLLLLTNGEVLAMGANNHAQLATGRTTRGTEFHGFVPELVLNANNEPLRGVTAVAAGGEHSLALLNTGGLVGWGTAGGGQLGVGATTECGTAKCVERAAPVLEHAIVEGKEVTRPVTGVTAISAGNSFSMFLKKGVLYTMGRNPYGELAIGRGEAGEDCSAEAPPSEEEEETEETPIEEREREKAETCSAEPLKVEEQLPSGLQHGDFEHVAAISAGMLSADAALESGYPPPPPLISLTPGGNPERKSLTISWTYTAPNSEAEYHIRWRSVKKEEEGAEWSKLATKYKTEAAAEPNEPRHAELEEKSKEAKEIAAPLNAWAPKSDGVSETRACTEAEPCSYSTATREGLAEEPYRVQITVGKFVEGTINQRNVIGTPR